MRRLFSDVACVIVVLLLPQATFGHAPFKKAIQEKYDLKSVSCFACHSRKTEIAEQDLPAFDSDAKSFRNAFGKQLGELLKGQETTKRLAEVKELKTGDAQKMKVHEAVVAEFLEALKKAEPIKSPTGPTYGELLKQGTLDGTRPK